MKESFYFSHDFNSHDDPKIRAMMRKFHHEGYGIFWNIIELLASETGRWYLPKDYKGLAYEMRSQESCIQSIVEDFNLFEFDDKNFWNKRLDKHFLQRAKKSKQASEAAKAMHKKRAAREAIYAVAEISQCEVDAIKERKGKEKKRKEIKTKFQKTVDDFILMRKSLKKPITERGIELILEKLEKLSGGDEDKKISILEQSIENSWQGVFEINTGAFQKKTLSEKVLTSKEYKEIMRWCENWENFKNPDKFVGNLFTKYSLKIIKKALISVKTDPNASPFRLKELAEYYLKKNA